MMMMVMTGIMMIMRLIITRIMVTRLMMTRTNDDDDYDDDNGICLPGEGEWCWRCGTALYKLRRSRGHWASIWFWFQYQQLELDIGVQMTLELKYLIICASGSQFQCRHLTSFQCCHHTFAGAWSRAHRGERRDGDGVFWERGQSRDYCLRHQNIR